MNNPIVLIVGLVIFLGIIFKIKHDNDQAFIQKCIQHYKPFICEEIASK